MKTVVEYFSSNSDIFGTYLINQFDIIFIHTIIGFENPHYFFNIGCYDNQRSVYPMVNLLSKNIMLIFGPIFSKLHKMRYKYYFLIIFFD